MGSALDALVRTRPLALPLVLGAAETTGPATGSGTLGYLGTLDYLLAGNYGLWRGSLGQL